VDAPDLGLSRFFDLKRCRTLQVTAVLLAVSFIGVVASTWTLSLRLKLTVYRAYVWMVWWSCQRVSAFLVRSMVSAATRIAQETFQTHQHDVIIASSFGGAVLLYGKAAGCFAGSANILFSPSQGVVGPLLHSSAADMIGLPPSEGTLVVHASKDETVPVEHSLKLITSMEESCRRIEICKLSSESAGDPTAPPGAVSDDRAGAKGREDGAELHQGGGGAKRDASGVPYDEYEIVDASAPPREGVVARLEMVTHDGHSLRHTYTPDNILLWLSTVRHLHCNALGLTDTSGPQRTATASRTTTTEVTDSQEGGEQRTGQSLLRHRRRGKGA